jgi:hypothetical protein
LGGIGEESFAGCAVVWDGKIVHQFIRQTGEVGALPEVGFDAADAAEAPFVVNQSFDESGFLGIGGGA